MTPSDINLPTPSFEFEELRTPPDSPVSERRNRNVPTNAAFNELCSNCKSVISHCNYCKFCVCDDLRDGISNNSTEFREVTHRKRLHPRNSSETVKVTVPQPFALSHMDISRKMAAEVKMCKLKEDLKNQAEKEMNVKIRSKPVPKNTRLPLYEKMVEEGKKRKAQRKEIGMEVSRNNIPSGAMSGSTDAMAEEKQKTFKAKPLPRHILSDKVSEKLKNKEELRKMLIAQRAEEILMSARSPFSERPRRTRSEVDLTDVVCKHDSRTSKKNISAITDRLYVKKEEILARKRREEALGDSEEDLVRKRKEALRSILPRLKSLLPVFDSQREIEDKVKNFRATQTHRQREYEKELEEIMMRVSKQLLLIERQSKVTKEDVGQSRGAREGSSGEPDGESDATEEEEEDAESETTENSES
ncbi:protein FAM161A-like [Uloborus diversus]|uniref:protein FAM161A-like n=1 Tax=Uloborus diversus TaxID=327109 RepID=UPI002409A5BD|nr:protein FAM161A-like [Uloborus diversus]